MPMEAPFYKGDTNKKEFGATTHQTLSKYAVSNIYDSESRTDLMGVVYKGSEKKVKPVSVSKIIEWFDNGKFDKQQNAYDLAKKKHKEDGGSGKLGKEKYFDSFTVHMVKDGHLKTFDPVHGWGGNNWKVSGYLHVDIDIEEEDWTFDLFQEIWNKLLKTKPLFMHPSANKGIKCYWKTDLENTQFNRENFQSIAQVTIKAICKKLEITDYYDPAPTDPVRISYAAGTSVNGKKFFYKSNDNSVLNTEKAIKIVKGYVKKKKELEKERDLLTAEIRKDFNFVTWDDLSDSEQGRIKDKAENSLNKYLNESNNSGNMTSFKLIGALVGYGMDDMSVRNYLSRFHAQKRHPKNWNPRNKVDEYYKKYPEKSRIGGKVKQNSKYKAKYDKINQRLVKVEELLRSFTQQDKKEEKQIIDSPLRLNHASDLNAILKTGLPGSGKSYTSVREAVDNVINNQCITYYVLPDIKSMCKSEDGSRYNEAVKYLVEKIKNNEINQVQYNKLISTFKSIYSGGQDEEREAVRLQHDHAYNELKMNRQGGIIFLTLAGLKYINLINQKDFNANIVFDDIDGMPKVSSQNSESKHWQKHEYDRLMDYLEMETNGDSNRVKGISLNGINYLAETESNGDSDAMRKRLLQAKDITNLNESVFYTTELQPNGKYSVNKLSMLNVDIILKMFDQITFAGDEVENNPLVQILKYKSGTKFKNIHLDVRANNLENRIGKIYYVTEHNFGKWKTKNTQSIPTEICCVLKGKFAVGRKSLCCLNKDQIDLGIFEQELSEHFDLSILTSNTKGKNNYKENDLILGLFKCDLNVSEKAVLSHVTGMSYENIDNWIQNNLLIQAMFRGALRYENDTRVNDIVVPMKDSAEYLQKRIFNELGFKPVVELLDKKLSDVYAPMKTGRKTFSQDGEAMTNQQKQIIKRLKKKHDNINNIIVSYGVKPFFETYSKLKGTNVKNEWIDSLKNDTKHPNREYGMKLVSFLGEDEKQVSRHEIPLSNGNMCHNSENDSVCNVENTLNFDFDVKPEQLKETNIIDFQLYVVQTMDVSNFNFGT